MKKYIKPVLENVKINIGMCLALSLEKKDSEIEAPDSFDPIYEN